MSTYHQRQKLVRDISQRLFKHLTIKDSYAETKEVVGSIILDAFSENSAFIYFTPEICNDFNLESDITLDIYGLEIANPENLEKFQKLVSFFFKLKWEVIMSPSRKREIVLSRQILSLWLKENTQWTLSRIANYLGGQDHSTVIHSIQTVRDQITVDKSLLNIWNNFNKFINVYIESNSSRGLGETSKESGGDLIENRETNSRETTDSKCLS
jgi:hypothetical protein